MAGLSTEPRSGYDLAGWFTRAANHYWHAHHSSIYPALAKLESFGFVAHDKKMSSLGPARKVYTLTPAGTSALLEWLLQPTAPREARDEQVMKALAYDLLPRDTAIQQLEAARTAYAAQLEEYEGYLRVWESFPVGHPLEGKLGPRLTIMHGIQVQRGYITWCDEATALLRAKPKPKPIKKSARAKTATRA